MCIKAEGSTSSPCPASSSFKISLSQFLKEVILPVWRILVARATSFKFSESDQYSVPASGFGSLGQNLKQQHTPRVFSWEPPKVQPAVVNSLNQNKAGVRKQNLQILQSSHEHHLISVLKHVSSSSRNAPKLVLHHLPPATWWQCIPQAKG